MTPRLSLIVLAGNEEKIISVCLRTCYWAKEIILIAANSTDNTVKIVKEKFPRVKIYSTTDEYNKNFSKWRNLGLSHAHGRWILYIDSDEQITLKLKQEIIKTINQPNPEYSYYVIPRANHYLGQRVRFGGSYPDYVKRLFLKDKFGGFTGQLHEEPVITGQPGYLCHDLLHFTHRDLFSMVQKSLAWTDMEAKELYLHQHPPVVWWRFPRMMLTKIFQRLIQQQMWRDGTVGWISVIFETFDTFMIYARLWELQQNPPEKL